MPFSHHVNCTIIPWGSSSLSVIPLVPVNSLHHCLVIRWCLSMFDSKTSFTWIGLYSEWRLNEFEDPRSSFILPGCDILRKIKTSSVHHRCTDNHPSQRVMDLPKSLVYHTDDCLSYVHENEFIKLSMGMPTSARSWKNVVKIMYCIVSYYRSPPSSKKLWILMVKHFTRHQKD